MSTFRVNKNVNYTVMSNHHLQDKRLSLKAKGLLSYMLSLPDDWDYSLKGLTTGCRDGIDSVRSAVHELEDGGYLCRSKVRDARGRIIDYNYVGKQPQTTKAIRLRLDKLTSQHVEYIFDVMSNTTQPIKNIMAYLRTTILNAPTTMEHYYQSQGNWLTAQSRKE